MQAAPTAPNCDLAQNSERSYSQRQGSVFSRCPLVMCSYDSEGAGRLTSSNSFWQCSGCAKKPPARRVISMIW